MLAGKFQVRQQLSFMNREKSLNSLQLENDFLFNDEVDLITATKVQTLVGDRQIDLTFEAQSSEV